MKKDFKSIAFLAVFTMIVGCAFYCIGFYDSAVFTLLVGLTMLAVYHAGLYNRGIIEDNTIASQKEIIERDKNLIICKGTLDSLKITSRKLRVRRLKSNSPDIQNGHYSKS